MNPQQKMNEKYESLFQQNFSLVQGGPLYQMLCRAGLETEDPMKRLFRRIIVISLFCWLPLFFLALLEGNLRGERVAMPFLYDFDMHIRFLISTPLLIAAELVVHRRIKPFTRQFLSRGLVPDNALNDFENAIIEALRLRNSVLAEVLLLVLVYGVGIMIVWNQFLALETVTWYANVGAGELSLFMAGKWLTYVSLPVFQFLLLRWYFRIFIWTRFLWRVSRIKLHIMPTHPDGIGGLGFLGATVFAFTPFLMAHGAQYAGLLANRIFFNNASLPEFFSMTGLLLIFLISIVFGPLLVFTPQLELARRTGIAEYSVLAAMYVREFDEKWIRGSAPDAELLLGNPDIQSLADMGSSFEVVKSMSIWAFSKEDVIWLTAITAAPLLPLGLTMMPLEELLKKLLGLLL